MNYANLKKACDAFGYKKKKKKKPANFRFLELAGSSELTSPHCTTLPLPNTVHYN